MPKTLHLTPYIDIPLVGRNCRGTQDVRIPPLYGGLAQTLKRLKTRRFYRIPPRLYRPHSDTTH